MHAQKCHLIWLMSRLQVLTRHPFFLWICKQISFMFAFHLSWIMTLFLLHVRFLQHFTAAASYAWHFVLHQVAGKESIIRRRETEGRTGRSALSLYPNTVLSLQSEHRYPASLSQRGTDAPVIIMSACDSWTSREFLQNFRYSIAQLKTPDRRNGWLYCFSAISFERLIGYAGLGVLKSNFNLCLRFAP